MTEQRKDVATIDANQGVSLAQMERAAAAMAASGFFGIKTKDEGLALMLVGQADGIHFAAAVRDYHIINGRPAMKAEAMLTRFLNAGGTVKWITLTDQKAEAEFSHPQGGTVRVDWDDARVALAGLKSSPNHNKYPRAMKRARVISEGIRTVFPGATASVYTVEEAQDIAFEEKIKTDGMDLAKAEQTADKPLGRAEDSGGTGLTDEEILQHEAALNEATTSEQLRHAFGSAWKHAGEAKDEASRNFFKKLYDDRKLATGW